MLSLQICKRTYFSEVWQLFGNSSLAMYIVDLDLKKFTS